MVTDIKSTQTGCSVLTLEDAKTYLRVSNDVEDAVIERMINSATEWAEAYTNRSFRDKEMEVLFTQLNGQLSVVLPESPVTDADEMTVQIAHKDGTFSATTFEYFGLNEITVTFPVVYSTKGVAGYKVNYTVGKYQSSVAVDAILKMVAEMYSVRGMSVEGSVSEATQLSVMKMLHVLKPRVVFQ